MTTTYLNFHAPINSLTAQHLMGTCANLVNGGGNEIYLLLSTPGGEVTAGITIYNFLRSLPVKITTHNMGNIDSIGNPIFLAGETRIACPHSTFMFHGVGFDIKSQRFEEKNLRESLDSILADQRRIAEIIADRTSITLGKARKLFAEARTKDANDALKNGIVSRIEELKIPSGAPILNLIFN
jgi:ATP-dependent protease ClpP protease subunit